MLDFSRRATTPELMDTEECDFKTFRDCLVDLARVNQLTLAYRPTIAFLNRLYRAGLVPPDRPLEIVDVGSGYGDMLRKIALWGQQRGINVRLTGVDLNPWSAKAAGAATEPGLPIVWRTTNIFDYRPAEGIDLVISSLFTHHLDDASLTRFLAWMEATATLGWFINDLRRDELPYRAFAVASRAMRMHRFVQNDGPISISRSFVPNDWQRLLALAGIPPESTDIEPWFPYRLCVSRVRAP